jgi:hypothetical protein
MTSGNHDHYCEKCGRRVACPQITHCNRPDAALCPDHIDAAVEEMFGRELDGLKGFNAAFQKVFPRR